MPAVSFRSLVLAALTAGDSLQNALEALQARAGTMSYPAYRDALAPIVGEKVGETPYESRKGGLTFEKNSAGEQRMKRLLRLHPEASGVKAEKREPVIRQRVVDRTTQACVDAIIAAGLSKAEFNALRAALRDAVTFQ